MWPRKMELNSPSSISKSFSLNPFVWSEYRVANHGVKEVPAVAMVYSSKKIPGRTLRRQAAITTVEIFACDLQNWGSILLHSSITAAAFCSPFGDK